MDLKIRELARQAGLGNLNAAKQLVRYLERSGVEDDEENLIALARKTILLYDKSYASEELDDLLESSNIGDTLAEHILKYFGQSVDSIRLRGPEIMECCGRFENEDHHPECPQRHEPNDVWEDDSQ